MQIETSSQKSAVLIGRETDRIEAEINHIESEWVILSNEFRQATRRHSYLRLVRWFRAPAATLNLWRTTVLLLGPSIVGAATLVLVHAVAGSLFVACCASLIGAAIGIVLFATLMYYPADRFLSTEIDEVEGQLKQLTERREQIASGRAKREALLQRDWKDIRGYDWENYLVEVCEALGAKVERTGQCGDQGCDLIVEFGTTRIAVQAKGFDERYPVNHKAVQEAYAGMAFKSCNACAVITNTQFRKSAKALAVKTGCILIGADEFPGFAMGNIELSRQF